MWYVGRMLQITLPVLRIVALLVSDVFLHTLDLEHKLGHKLDGANIAIQ